MDNTQSPQPALPNEPTVCEFTIPGKGHFTIKCEAFVLYFGSPDGNASFTAVDMDGKPMMKTGPILVSNFIGGAPDKVGVIGAYGVTAATAGAMGMITMPYLLNEGIVVYRTTNSPGRN